MEYLKGSVRLRAWRTGDLGRYTASQARTSLLLFPKSPREVQVSGGAWGLEAATTATRVQLMQGMAGSFSFERGE